MAACCLVTFGIGVDARQKPVTEPFNGFADAALIDAAAVVGMCHGANCVADACGVRIDGLGVPFAAHVLAELKMGAPPPSWRVSGAMRWASGRFGWFALRMMHAVAVMRPRQ